MDINNISIPAQKVLIEIGLSWDIIIGPSGSYVHNTSLKKLLEAKQPISVNKMTDSGRGRNGVIYSIIPMCKRYRLIDITDGNHQSYMLNDLGREVIEMMVSTCSYCNDTKLCRFCNGNGIRIDIKCGHNDWNGNRAIKKSSEECDKCDGNNLFCYQCKTNPGVCDICGDDEDADSSFNGI